MKSLATFEPQFESQDLLSLPPRQAEAIFQSYTVDQQLQIISATRNVLDRENLYYLVPDCTELIQLSPTIDVLQILGTMIGKGIASCLIPCLSAEQFEEMMDIVLWKDGQLDENALNTWLFELSQCDIEDLAKFLRQIDIGTLAYMLRGKMEIEAEFKGLFIQAGVVDPKKDIKFNDERAKTIILAIWSVDGELFTRLLYEIFELDRDQLLDDERSLEQAREDRDARIEHHDRKIGINITEDQLREKVDLDQLDLDEDDDEKSHEWE